MTEPLSPQSAAVSADERPLPAGGLEAERTRLIFEQVPTFHWLGFLSAVIVVWMYWSKPQFDQSLLLRWISLYTIYHFTCALGRQVFHRTHPTSIRDLKMWRRLVFLASLVHGGLWGAAGVLFHPDMFHVDPSVGVLYQGIFATLLGGLSIFALASYSIFLPALLAFLLGALVPCIVYVLLSRTFPGLILGSMGSIYVLFLVIGARRLNTIHLDTLKLQFKNVALIRFLERSRADAEALNDRLKDEIGERRTAESRMQELNEQLEDMVDARTHELWEANIRLEESQGRLQLAIDASHIGLWDWHLPSDITYHSNFDKLLGYSNDEVQGFMGHLKPLVHPEDFILLRRALVSHLKGRTPEYHIIYRIRHKDGHYLWVEDEGQVIERDDKGFAIRMIGTRRDITEEREAQEQLRLSASVFDNAAEAIFVMDQQFRFITVNQYFTQISGYTLAEVQGSSILDARRDTSTFGTFQNILRELDKKGQWAGEITERRKNGEMFPEWLRINAVRDEAGVVTHYVGLFSDLTARKEAEEKLRYLSNYDRLTGFANRTLFRDRLHTAINRKRDDGGKLAVLHIDIDRFRQINDTLGHEVGDRLLSMAGKRLSVITPQVDTLARMGGDEFTVIVDNYAENSDLEKLCDTIISEMRRPFHIDQHELLMGASIGMSLFPDNGREMQILLNHADTAMHQAKRLGGNTFRFYTHDLRVVSIEQLNLETNLRKAIFRNEFVVHYQPKVDLGTDRIVGVEALVRWNHPTMGLVQPKDFVPLAEETGLISAISEMVLERACREAKIWLEAGLGDIRTAVNLSAHQLRKGNLPDIVNRVLKSTGLKATQLELEITESTLMEDVENAIRVLTDLRAMGIEISLDDFGTGYSSLSYLKRFPIDNIKIDQSFIRDVHQNKDDAAIVKAIIAMAHSLGMRVIAEGVEQIEHIDFLREEGCDYIQGYYISRPVTDERLAELLRAQLA